MKRIAKTFNTFLIFAVKLRAPGERTFVRARCYRSMKKNEEPHKLSVSFEHEAPPSVSSFECSCAAGQGLCQHVIGLMYTLAHYQMLGLKNVPPVISKTSKPQVHFYDLVTYSDFYLNILIF